MTRSVIVASRGVGLRGPRLHSAGQALDRPRHPVNTRRQVARARMKGLPSANSQTIGIACRANVLGHALSWMRRIPSTERRVRRSQAAYSKCQVGRDRFGIGSASPPSSIAQASRTSGTGGREGREGDQLPIREETAGGRHPVHRRHPCTGSLSQALHPARRPDGRRRAAAACSTGRCEIDALPPSEADSCHQVAPILPAMASALMCDFGTAASHARHTPPVRPSIRRPSVGARAIVPDAELDLRPDGLRRIVDDARHDVRLSARLLAKPPLLVERHFDPAGRVRAGHGSRPDPSDDCARDHPAASRPDTDDRSALRPHLASTRRMPERRPPDPQRPPKCRSETPRAPGNTGG